MTDRGEAARHLPTWFAAGVFGVVLAFSVATVVFAVAVRESTACRATTVVRVAAGGVLFKDAEVQRELACHGFTVELREHGSRAIATADLSRYDAVSTASGVITEGVRANLRQKGAKEFPSYSPFSSPLVIVSFTPIARLLQEIGVATPKPDGTWSFDVKAYLDVVARQTRWTDVPGNRDGSVYNSPNRILLATTDPAQSNSAYLFIAIMSYVLNGNTAVSDGATVDRLLPQIIPAFKAQGALPDTTPKIVERYLQGGMDAVPMGLTYENDYVTYIRNSPPDSTPADIALMYPSPTILSDVTYIPLTDAGNRLLPLLGDPELSRLAVKNGYRTSRAIPPKFLQDMAARDIVVAHEFTFAKPPTFEILERFVDGIVEG